MTMPPDPPAIPDDEDDASEAAKAAEFAAMLADFEKSKGLAPAPKATRARQIAADGAPRVGSRLRAKVVSVSGDTVLFDIGGRSEAVGDARAFRKDDGTSTIEAGSELELFVLESGEQIVLGRSARSTGGARGARVSLEAVRQAKVAEVPVRGKVTAVNTGGLQVDVDGVRAFCPLSQIDLTFVEDPAPYVGRGFEFLVTEVDESRQRVVVSRKKLLQREQASKAQERLASIAPGQDLEGRIARLEPFGAFVDLGGIDGLIHVSELSHARIAHPREVVSQGDQVKVRVLKVEPGKDGRPRVALSLRAATPDPWTTSVQTFSAGQRVSGVVVRLADFGAFVNLAPGIDGLVHVSQISNRRITHPREVLSPGQAVEAVVLAVEPERKRISLSMREASEDPIPASRVERTSAPERGSSAGSGARPSRPAQRGGGAGGGARGGRRDEMFPRDEAYEAPPKPVDDSPTPMQIALRKAREEAERKAQKRAD